jgi:hypothetical protein
MTNVYDAGGEIDVVPAQPEHLGKAHARVRPSEKQRPIPARTGGEEASEIRRGKDALVGAERVRPLVTLKPVEGMRSDVAATKRKGEDAAERAEDPLDRPGRETIRLQLAHDPGHIVGGDQHQTASAEPGQQVAAQLRAVEIKCAIAPLTRCDLRLELGEPASRHFAEREPRRERQVADSASLLQEFALISGLDKGCRFERAKARPPVDPHADRVLAIRLPVDPTLNAHASAATAARHPDSSVRELRSGRMNREGVGRSYSSGNDGKLNSA